MAKSPKPAPKWKRVSCDCAATRGDEVCVCNNTEIKQEDKAHGVFICGDCSRGKHQFL